MSGLGLFTNYCSLYTVTMSWASRRRTLYSLAIGSVLVLLIGVPLGMYLYEQPTCTDGKKNQSETDIDKGGPCTILDERTLAAHATLFVRAFPVRPGEYGVTAYVQNPNRSAGVSEARYRVSVYDQKNVLIAEREGQTPIMPGGITPVYEPGIMAGGRTASRAFFEFTETLVWVSAKADASSLVVSNTAIRNLDTEPELSAEVTNTSVATVLNVRYVATLFDAAGDAFASSETIIPSLGAGKTRTIVFTWPQAFSVAPARIDVLPVVPFGE